jgi:hypothetical protein
MNNKRTKMDNNTIPDSSSSIYHAEKVAPIIFDTLYQVNIIQQRGSYMHEDGARTYQVGVFNNYAAAHLVGSISEIMQNLPYVPTNKKPAALKYITKAKSLTIDIINDRIAFNKWEKEFYALCKELGSEEWYEYDVTSISNVKSLIDAEVFHTAALSMVNTGKKIKGYDVPDVLAGLLDDKAEEDDEYDDDE